MDMREVLVTSAPRLVEAPSCRRARVSTAPFDRTADAAASRIGEAKSGGSSMKRKPERMNRTALGHGVHGA